MERLAPTFYVRTKKELSDDQEIPEFDTKKYWPSSSNFLLKLSLTPSLGYVQNEQLISLCAEKYSEVISQIDKFTKDKVERVDDFIRAFKKKDSYSFMDEPFKLLKECAQKVKSVANKTDHAAIASKLEERFKPYADIFSEFTETDFDVYYNYLKLKQDW